MPFDILRENKSKIVRVSARSIWAGMTHILESLVFFSDDSIQKHGYQSYFLIEKK